MLMLSLFYDLQNPMFKKHDFDATQFLEGVGPALENYHNLSGALENELHDIYAKKQDDVDGSNEDSGEEKDATKIEMKGLSEEEKDAVTSTINMIQKHLSPDQKIASAVLEHDWTEVAKKEPESVAGQLSRMLTDELFGHFQLSAKTAFLLHSRAGQLKFDEGSCTVNNVALLSARAFRCKELPLDESNDEDPESSGPRYEILDDFLSDNAEGDEQESDVAAQLEVLYDVTSHFSIDRGNDASDDNESEKGDQPTEMDTTVVSVAVLEGFLKGGPEGELRWKLALHRPAFEFPGMQ
ncbi:unnamed protein product [Cylindrotheca closterium]|uniref:Uncharacterized protein n=1 Tax=Cylindrotheca closterium TaxID=2856 RepID=A0AAD2CKS6_9STRA|nr:unnamed protein product [Cylindrotheca closterium]